MNIVVDILVLNIQFSFFLAQTDFVWVSSTFPEKLKAGDTFSSSKDKSYLV